MAIRWYYVVGGKELGPVGTDELRRLATLGRITPNHQIRRSDMAVHVTGAQINGLFPPCSGSNQQLWYFSKNDEQHGPISSQQLRELALSRELLPSDLVCPSSTTNWTRAESVKGLFDVPAARASPPPLPTKEKPVFQGGTQAVSDDKATVFERQDSATPRSSQANKFHKQRIAILAAAILGMIATFLPWVHAPIVGAVAGTAGDGWITLALFAPALCIALIGDTTRPIVGVSRIVVTIPVAIAVAIGGWKIADFQSRKEHMANDSEFGRALSISVQIGNGIYLLIIAGLALLFVAWYFAVGSNASKS